MTEQTLTGGPRGPMIDRPGSPGAPYGQIREVERQWGEEVTEKRKNDIH